MVETDAIDRLWDIYKSYCYKLSVWWNVISWNIKTGLKDSHVHISPWQCVRCELSWKPRSHTQVCFPPGWSTQRPRPHTPGLLSHTPRTAARTQKRLKVRRLCGVLIITERLQLTSGQRSYTSDHSHKHIFDDFKGHKIFHSAQSKTVLSNWFCFDLNELFSFQRTEQMKNVLPRRRSSPSSTHSELWGASGSRAVWLPEGGLRWVSTHARGSAAGPERGGSPLWMAVDRPDAPKRNDQLLRAETTTTGRFVFSSSFLSDGHSHLHQTKVQQVKFLHKRCQRLPACSF